MSIENELQTINTRLENIDGRITELVSHESISRGQIIVIRTWLVSLSAIITAIALHITGIII